MTLIAILTIRSGLRRLNVCCSTYQFPPSVLSQIGTLAAYTSPTPPPADAAPENAAAADAEEEDVFDEIVESLRPYEEEEGN